MNVTIVHGIEGAREATGHVVIIDVLRAFTTAAYAFAAGAEEIDLVADVEEARRRPGFKMGEVGGRLIPGFDHNNSPFLMIGRKIKGRAVQRTGSGTQGVVMAKNAETIWLGSLVVASATARALRTRDEVTLVATGVDHSPEEPGEEDIAGAIYLEALLRGQEPPRERVVEMVRTSGGARFYKKGDPDRPIEDLDCACDIDRFDFAMKVERRGGRLLAVSKK